MTALASRLRNHARSVRSGELEHDRLVIDLLAAADALDDQERPRRELPKARKGVEL